MTLECHARLLIAITLREYASHLRSNARSKLAWLVHAAGRLPSSIAAQVVKHGSEIAIVVSPPRII